jgi:hypothetical protein
MDEEVCPACVLAHTRLLTNAHAATGASQAAAAPAAAPGARLKPPRVACLVLAAYALSTAASLLAGGRVPCVEARQLRASPGMLLLAPLTRPPLAVSMLNAAAWAAVACPLERALGSAPLAHAAALLATLAAAGFFALLALLAPCERASRGGTCGTLLALSLDACVPLLPGATLALAALAATRGGATQRHPWLPWLSAPALALALALLFALSGMRTDAPPPLLWLACCAASGVACGRGALGRLAVLSPAAARAVESHADACTPAPLRDATELVPSGGSGDLPAPPAPSWPSGLAAWLSSAFAAPAAPAASPRFRHDCFLSYRRADFAVADAVEAQLRLAGLDVFQDRSAGGGQPFDAAIVAALAGSAVFCPLITLAVMRSLCDVDDARVDWCLLEFVCATELYARGALRALYPLAVGEECASPDGRPARDRLFSNSAFKVRLCGLLPCSSHLAPGLKHSRRRRGRDCLSWCPARR